VATAFAVPAWASEVVFAGRAAALSAGGEAAGAQLAAKPTNTDRNAMRLGMEPTTPCLIFSGRTQGSPVVP